MNEQILVLCLSAASLGFIHTALGPDHYVPFIVMSRARNWTTLKTAIITMLCGIGHVGSSIIIGAIGIAAGIGLSRVEGVEGSRGDYAAWAFLIFGYVYMIWGMKKAGLPLKKIIISGIITGIIFYIIYFIKGNGLNFAVFFTSFIPVTGLLLFAVLSGLGGLVIFYIFVLSGKYLRHVHIHAHPGGVIHKHEHVHSADHDHIHKNNNSANLTPWILFLIFVLGPCEPLIPFLMYPAAKHNTLGIVAVSLVFSIVTILTMIVIVLVFSLGIRSLSFGKLEKYTNAVAGATILLSGCAIIFLGL
jgi:nickel/cobalt exporter